MKKFLTFILVLAMVLSVSSFAMAEGYVAKIDSTEYATFNDAITAANGMTGKVTVEIYGKVEYSDTTPNLTGAYDSISFEGKTSDAEISITRNDSGGYISGTDGQDCTVSFTDLKCSKPAGYYAGDAGFMNVYFTVYRVGNVSYTRCTFPDGACCQGKKATYTNCTFNNTTSGEYSLWVYAGVECIVENCTFSGVRGVKMYTEPNATLSTLKIIDSIFEDTITEKAAVVLTKGKSIELKGNTYNNPEDKGTVEVDGDYYSDICDIAEVIIESKEYKVGEGEATSGAVLKVEADTVNTDQPTVTPTPENKSSGSGISVKYNGGNSFSTSKSAVPTSVEIDGVPVAFNGDGSSFTVSSIPANAKWVTVRWNSTSVTTNFIPNGAYTAEINIPKTGDMPVWAAVAAFFGF